MGYGRVCNTLKHKEMRCRFLMASGTFLRTFLLLLIVDVVFSDESYFIRKNFKEIFVGSVSCRILGGSHSSAYVKWCADSDP